MSVALIAARSENGVIGHGGKIPWHLPADLKHFKALTTGNVIVMGRKTFEAIGRPLGNRLTVVISRDTGYTSPGITVVNSPEAALEYAEQGLLTPGQRDGGEIFVVGGAEIYRLALPFAERMYLTRIHAVEKADVGAVWKEFDLHEAECQRLLNEYDSLEDAAEKSRFPIGSPSSSRTTPVTPVRESPW